MPRHVASAYFHRFLPFFLSFFLSFFQKQELMHLSEEEKQQSGRQISPTWVSRERCWCNTSWQIIKDLAIKIKEALFILWNCPWILFMISGRELESRERIRIKVLYCRFSFKMADFWPKTAKSRKKIKNSKIYFQHFVGPMVLHIWSKFHVSSLILEGEHPF